MARWKAFYLQNKEVRDAPLQRMKHNFIYGAGVSYLIFDERPQLSLLRGGEEKPSVSSPSKAAPTCVPGAVEVFSRSDTDPTLVSFYYPLPYSMSVCEMGKVAPPGLGHLEPEVPIGPW